MTANIGIRHEDKYELERRTPLVPSDVKEILTTKKIKVFVERSDRRVFADEEYRKAGAELTDSMAKADIIFGVKEVTIPSFEQNKTYVFFSHIIKGQKYNMPMLKEMISKKINLIDYEKISDSNNKRLIFFGNFAGLAGMIDSIWAAGLRFEHFGFKTPFKKLQQAKKYGSLEEAKKVFEEISSDISSNGLPEELCPFVVGFTGYGNVSNGAQEILDILPVEEITPEMLKDLKKSEYSNKKVYKVVFKERDISRHKDKRLFDLHHYYNNPGEYESIFEQYIPHMTVLMNCMYWSQDYPRLVTKDYLANNYSNNFKLKVIGDITCDVHGSVECTEKGAPIDDPIFIYNTDTKTIRSGYEGEGLLMMTVDILPSELPKESSEFFSSALTPFIISIAECDFTKPFGNITLPPEIKKALILLNGKFTPGYEYIQDYLK